MNIKENQKYQQTHQKIMDTIVELLQQKSLKQITVAEVCRIVHINRSTFYEHFLDVYDVMEKIELEISKEIDGIFNYENTHIHPPKEGFLRFFHHIKENRKFYIVYLEQGLVMSVWRTFAPNTDNISQEVVQSRRITSPILFEYATEIRLAGIKALVSHWLKRDCKDTPEELYDIFEKLSMPFDKSREN